MKKYQTIKKKEEFTKIIQARQYVTDKNLTFYYQPKALADNRVGLSVTTKLGTAVQRNRAKRQLRMMVAEYFDWQERFDTVIIIRASFKESSFEDNKKGFEKCYKKVKMLTEKD